MIANQFNSCGREARGQRKSIHVWLMAASAFLIVGLVGSDPAYSRHPFDGMECVFTAGDMNSDYYHKETHKWVRNGPPSRTTQAQGRFIDTYPMTWTLTIEGHNRIGINNQTWSADNRMNPGSGSRWAVTKPSPSSWRIRATAAQQGVVGPTTGTPNNPTNTFEEYIFGNIVTTDVHPTAEDIQLPLSGKKTEEWLDVQQDVKSRKRWLIWKDSKSSLFPIGSNSLGKPSDMPIFLSCQMNFTISR